MTTLASARATDADPATRGRVLIAENETLVRLDLRTTLEGRGWHVCGEARDGREAVRLARGLEPDVALMDIKMPGLDGVEATRLIRRERPTPVVMMTAFDRPSSLVRSLVAGATSYLVKPFVEDELDARIAAASRPGHRAGAPGGKSMSPRRAEIVAVARRLFATRGYAATSIQDLADEVGMLKGSLYYHIASKDELVTTIVCGFLDAGAAVLRHAEESGGSPRRRLRRFVTARRALHLYDWQAAAVAASSTRTLEETGLLRPVSEAAVRDAQFVVEALADGEARGLFRLSNDPEPVARHILDVVAAARPAGERDLGASAVDREAHSCAAFVLAAVGVRD